MMLLTAAAAEPPRTWAGIIALAIACAIFWAISGPLRRWHEARTASTPPALGAGSRPKVQATVGVNDDDTDREPWWGRILTLPGGIYVRQAKQILTTGSSQLPEPDEDIDVPLDDDEEEEEQVDADEKMEAYIGRALDIPVPYNDLVRICMDHYEVSKSTAKRAIAKVRAERAGGTGEAA